MRSIGKKYRVCICFRGAQDRLLGQVSYLWSVIRLAKENKQQEIRRDQVSQG
jgi:hypothetical protein